MSGFGIDENTKSSNRVDYGKGGIFRATLVDVVSTKLEKKDKSQTYDTLQFKFVDVEGLKTYTKTYFPVKEDGKYDANLEAMNVSIKHIYEAFLVLKGGLGVGAKDFKEFFDKVAEAFNKNGANGTPIYKDEKGIPYLCWIKLVFFNNKIGFPYSPNFIERIGKNGRGENINNQQEPKTLIINVEYDKTEQVKPTQHSAMGGGVNTGGGNASDDHEF